MQSCIWRQLPGHQITASVILIVAGCIVAGIGDLTFDVVGYAYAMLSCLCQAAYLLCVEFQVQVMYVTSRSLVCKQGSTVHGC